MDNTIRQRRKERGISQEELAVKCGVSRQTVNAIENNKYDPTLTLAFHLAQELGTTVDELFKTRMGRKMRLSVTPLNGNCLRKQGPWSSRCHLYVYILLPEKNKVNATGQETFGMLFYAEISRFGEKPESEIEEVRLLPGLPSEWTYPLYSQNL